MTPEEEEVLKPLLRTMKTNELQDPVPLDDSDEDVAKHRSFTATLVEVLEKRDAALEKKTRYDEGVHAILGVAVEVERLWSMADNVFTKRRSRMSPLLFECIMYLKYNRDLWNLDDIVEANKRRKNESQAAKQAQIRARVADKRAEVEKWDSFQMSL